MSDDIVVGSLPRGTRYQDSLNAPMNYVLKAPVVMDPTVETWALEFPGALTMQALEAIRAQLAEGMPGKRVVIVQGGAHFRALEPLDAAVTELEAALPEGWVYKLEGGLDHYHAAAYLRSKGPRVDCIGSTLTMAVRALTAQIKEPSRGA